MKNSMKVFVGATIVLLASTVSACQKKEPAGKQDTKVIKVERVEKLSLESLDHRVTVLEEARARANAKAKKFSPAPAYNPNYKG